MLILDKDPLQSAENYRSIHAILKDGVAVDRSALVRICLLILRSVAERHAYVEVRAPAVIRYGDPHSQWNETGLFWRDLQNRLRVG